MDKGVINEFYRFGGKAADPVQVYLTEAFVGFFLLVTVIMIVRELWKRRRR